MALHNVTGNIGEQLAREYLEKKGFAIMETNWRKGKYEVDIIAVEIEGLDYHITHLENAFNAAELSLIRRPKSKYH